MNRISWEEYAQIRDRARIIDLRKEEDFLRDSPEEAVSIPLPQLREAANLPAADQVICLLSYTEAQCEDAETYLREKGCAVRVLEGGYPRHLRRRQEELLRDESVLSEKTRQIERSIITKFRKQLWRPFTKAVKEYQLILPHEKIAVCISGGKDSMLLAKLLQELQKHGEAPFELVFLMMDPGYREDNRQIIENNARILGIPLTVFGSEIFDVVAGIEKNPCYLCARMRRGYLYAKAKELGCSKIALGHHFDDVIETTLMGMLYGGKIETMMPKLHSQNFAGMELIRPMYMVKEAAVKAWRDYHHLGFIQCACRFTETQTSYGGGQASKRDEIKALIAELRQRSEFVDSNIFRSVHNINLRTVIGYHKDDWSYHFLDDYEKYANTEEFT